MSGNDFCQADNPLARPLALERKISVYVYTNLKKMSIAQLFS
ncbi:hypothetical protein HMPREF9086_3262 [Enterobacter hormaechei ATCC 49162]|nr:hypothetical protein HMPREF9086_3262 [Enterobacter hormaechei ATCC 49162]